MDTNFTPGTVVASSWLNDVNDYVYNDKGRRFTSVFDFFTEAQILDVSSGALTLDVSSAVQTAINSVKNFGGVLIFPKGRYLFSTQVTIDRTYAAITGGFVGERNLSLSGYGAEIHTTGAISAFRVLGGWAPNRGVDIEGFLIYHRQNTQATAGIEFIGASLCTVREVSVAVGSTLPAGYGAFTLSNVDPTSSDTGCFWITIERCVVRPWSGADGNCTYGVRCYGSANALTLRGNVFSGSTTHVYIGPHPGYTISANSTLIDGNFFEGPTSATAIHLVGAQVTYHVTGTRIIGNRFESLDTAVKLTGSGTTVQLPTVMVGNYADTSVPNYLVNASNIPLVMLDANIVGSDMGPMKLHNVDGLIVRNDDGTTDALTVEAANTGRGVKLARLSDGLEMGRWSYESFADGVGSKLGGSVSTYRPLRLVGVRGISTTDTVALNLTGTVTFSASTTATVTFPTAEADTSYAIFLESSGNVTLWVSSKTTGGFTVNASSSNSNTVRWLLVRI